MILYDTTIKKGQNTVVKIPVANLPSGTEINLQAHVFRSKKPGPVLLLVGGLHGDEINGVETDESFFNDLKSRTEFDSIEDLLTWYKHFYLPMLHY